MTSPRCRITLDPLKKSREIESGFSMAGLKYLTGSAGISPVLPFTAQDFISRKYVKQKGMSISGAQPKLQLITDEALTHFDIVNQQGNYILKPSPAEYPNLAEVEHCIMKVMERLGFDTPPSGMLKFAADDSGEEKYAFVIKRFDRDETGKKIHQEQLDGAMAITEKYGKTNEDGSQSVSYEQIGLYLKRIRALKSVRDIAQYFNRIVYAYLLGNNDLHLRNFGLVGNDKRVTLAPVYDFVSVAPYPETFGSCYLALPLLCMEETHENQVGDVSPGFDSKYGEYIGLDFSLFGEGLGLSKNLVTKMLTEDLQKERAIVVETITNSFVPADMQEAILRCFNQRLNRLQVFDVN